MFCSIGDTGKVILVVCNEFGVWCLQALCVGEWCEIE